MNGLDPERIRKPRGRKRTISTERTTDEPRPQRGKHTRIWLFGLLVLAALFAGGALFVKYKLDSLRDLVLDAAANRTGARIEIAAVSATGLRGLRLDDVAIEVAAEGSPSFSLRVPHAYIRIDFVDLLYGDLTIDRVQIDDAAINIERPADAPWFDQKAGHFRVGSELAGNRAFRILGKNCQLHIENIVRQTALDVSALDFDVYSLADSPHILAQASGTLNEDAKKRLDATLFFTSPSEFELIAECSEIATEDVNVFLPASKRFVESGTVHPKVRVVGYPEKRLMLWVEAPFEDVAIRNQPPFLQPATGSLALLASYDIANHLLSVETSRAESDQIGGGKLAGSIAFHEDVPVFDLRMEVTRLPAKELLDFALRGQAEDLGELDVTLQEPYEVALTLTGDIDDPRIAAQVNAASGELTFAPVNKRHPKASLKFTAVEAGWDSVAKKGRASLNVVGGGIAHPGYGLEAENITGRLVLEDKSMRMDPLNIQIGGQNLVGTIDYDLTTAKGKAEVSGTLAHVEDTKLKTAIKDITLAGSIVLTGKAQIAPGRYAFDVETELTQTQVDYKWWYRKPIGTGISTKIHAEILPKKKVTISGEVDATGTHLSSVFTMVHTGKNFSLMHSDTKADKLDLDLVAACLRLPYEIHGGSGTDLRYEWTRDEPGTKQWHARLTGKIDEVVLRPNGGKHDHSLKRAELTLDLVNGADATGHLYLRVAEALMAPLGAKWFEPMECPPELLDRFPPTERGWTYELAAQSIDVAPWKGTDFSATAHHNKTSGGLQHYAATVAKGHIEGNYTFLRDAKTYEASAQWADVPAEYLLDHLKFPRVLSGTVTGDIAYRASKEDPKALNGQGRFTVRNGQFSPEFIADRLMKETEQDKSLLPPSLEFSELNSALQFKNGIVVTDPLSLNAEGIKITAAGQFVSGGDMDYTIKVAVSPDTAEKIQVLADSFNVRGYRLANKDIELEFKVSGPTLRPTSELAGAPPARVTLVSGALQATSDAMKVIDIPRKILVDVLKTGAGIVGVRKQEPEGNQ